MNETSSMHRHFSCKSHSTPAQETKVSVVAKVKERLTVNKQKSQRFHMESFNLKNLNEVESKDKYRVEVSNRSANLDDLDTEVEINSAWETIKEIIKISAKESVGYYELRKHKPWFNERCSELLDEKKQAKFQWLQDPSEINGDNLNNIRCEASRYCRTKKKEYLKD
jgi:50S ribosomal subunit-associated GTPase HflX